MLELCPSQGQLESKGHRGLEPRHAFSEISATSILAVWRNRSLASFLVRIRSDPKTVQTLLHHSDVKLTLQRYPQYQRGSHGCGSGNADCDFQPRRQTEAD